MVVGVCVFKALCVCLCVCAVFIFGILPAADFLVVFSSVLQCIDVFQWMLFAVPALGANAWRLQLNSYILMQLLCCRSGNDSKPHLHRTFMHFPVWMHELKWVPIERKREKDENYKLGCLMKLCMRILTMRTNLRIDLHLVRVNVCYGLMN